MLNRIVRIFLAGIVLLLALAAVAWSVLAVPYFSNFRSALVSDFLSDQIGQPLFVNGDVSVVVGPTTRVRAKGVQIPSENIEDTDLARLDSLEFDVELLALLERRVRVNNLFVDGLHVALRISEDGSKSWNERDRVSSTSGVPEPVASQEPKAPDEAEPQGDLLTFLRSRTFAFTNIRLVYDDELTGFEYDFNLEELSLNQLDGGTVQQVLSQGTVNGQPFRMEGTYPRGAPFTTKANFSSVGLTFDGKPLPVDEGGGFEGVLDVDVAGVADLLGVLKLKRSFDGSGRLKTKLVNRDGKLSVSDVVASLELEEGQHMTITGEVDDLSKFSGVDMRLDARLHPENQPPPAAQRLVDLRLKRITTRIVTLRDALELEGLLIETNAFEQGLEKLGPVSVARIRRTDAGTLAFQNIFLQAGPEDAPILVARGDIENILELKQLTFAGEIDAPATFFLLGLQKQVAEAFGGIEADFALSDAGGEIALTRLAAKAVDTDLWNLSADIEVADVDSLDGLRAEIAVGVGSSAEFLRTLGLEPVADGAVAAALSAQGGYYRWSADLNIDAGRSTLATGLSTSIENDRPTVRAAITSDAIAIADLKNAAAVSRELSKLTKLEEKSAAPGRNNAREVPLQPLVLPDESDPAQDVAQSDDDNDQPGTPQTQTKGLGFFHDLLRRMDIFAQIDLKEISGINGVTSLSSELVLQDRRARLGPVDFSYGRAQFSFEAEADIDEVPSRISMAGATTGWTLGGILDLVGVKFDADGGLSGRFNLQGNLTSARTFMDTANGTASVQMQEGRVATSLLELAGLGVFPWLFSNEFRQGYTDIACVSLPLKIDRGKLSSDALVAETRSVQLVARGTVDPKGDTIALRAEPRPLGKPLARSAWPFEVSGKLSNPHFKLLVGGLRSKRADGASEMPAERRPCRPDIYQLH